MSKLRKFATAAGVLAFAATGLTMGVGSASAAPSTFEMRRVFADGDHEALCLGIQGGGSVNGGYVIQWSCNGNADQKWYLAKDAHNHTVIKNRGSNKCLDVPGGDMTPGRGLVQWDCNNGDNQAWYVSDQRYGTVFQNKQSGLVIDLWMDSESSGSPAIQWGWSGATNQQWFLSPA
ncbi:RICIN domain-containing protein [Embleya sp. MST-111070]|uniref:RICIN domain-containing protein n=1 Tax=Embleya sp. MST-111070 TaxID=3398231 RepID=UPI003F741313